MTLDIANTADAPSGSGLGGAESAALVGRRLGGLRSGKIITGLVLLGVFVGAAIFGPIFDHTDPSALSRLQLAAPSGAHWLGTTQTGQDVFAQLLDGTRTSLLVGFVSGAIATVLSVIIGLASGYLGGVADEVLSVLSNIFLVIPALPLVIVLAVYLPNRGDLSVAVVIAVTGWAWGARVLRAQTLSIRRRDYVEAARATGESTMRILFAEILPNETAIIASGFLFTVIFAILTQAGLAYLGLSSVSTWSWGTMLYWAQNGEALQVGAWWWFVPPGLCIALVGTALALINFGIDEFVNPRLRTAGVGTRAAARALRRQPGTAAPGAAGSQAAGSRPRADGTRATASAPGGRPAFTPVNRPPAGGGEPGRPGPKGPADD
jgi:ABC-type dipeptide/oligopeptide/nickel transport system permease subunit